MGRGGYFLGFTGTVGVIVGVTVGVGSTGVAFGGTGVGDATGAACTFGVGGTGVGVGVGGTGVGVGNATGAACTFGVGGTGVGVGGTVVGVGTACAFSVGAEGTGVGVGGTGVGVGAVVGIVPVVGVVPAVGVLPAVGVVPTIGALSFIGVRPEVFGVVAGCTFSLTVTVFWSVTEPTWMVKVRSALYVPGASLPTCAAFRETPCVVPCPAASCAPAPSKLSQEGSPPLRLAIWDVSTPALPQFAMRTEEYAAAGARSISERPTPTQAEAGVATVRWIVTAWVYPPRLKVSVPVWSPAISPAVESCTCT